MYVCVRSNVYIFVCMCDKRLCYAYACVLRYMCIEAVVLPVGFVVRDARKIITQFARPQKKELHLPKAFSRAVKFTGLGTPA